MDKIPVWLIYAVLLLEVALGALVATEGLTLPKWAIAANNVVAAVATWLALQMPGKVQRAKDKGDAG